MKYNLYAMGNALVDMEFHVKDDFFQRHGIEKGLMTLIDEERQALMLGELEDQFGLIKRVSGGSAANTVVALAQLGGKGFYACKVANDEAGSFYHHDLTEAGVITLLDQHHYDGITGKCVVMVSDDADRTMATYLGITADFSEEDLHLNELEQADYLYIEGYLVTSDVSLSAAIRARGHAQKHAVKTAFTFSDSAMVRFYKDGIKTILGDGVDVLYCNEEEALIFTETQSLRNAFEALKPFAGKIIITRGAKGAIVVTDDIIEIQAEPTKVIDTNGAGDMFAGAFMYGLTHGFNDKDSARLAIKAAARTVATYGARLPNAVLLETKASFK